MKYFLLGLLVIAFSCSSSKSGVNVSPEKKDDMVEVETEVVSVPCDHTATILSFTQEDPNCAVLFELANGMMFQPILLPDPNFTFNHGDRVRISYDILDNYEKGCSKAMAMAQVTCLEKDYSFDHGKGQCVNTIDVFSVPWMNDVLNKMNAGRVTKYDFEEKYAYGFKSQSGEVIFDCHGTEICRSRPQEGDQCFAIRNKLTNQQVVLVINE